MRAASHQAVDRVLGVLVAVCASAVLVAIGARAGPSLTTLLRLTYYDRYASSGSNGSGTSKNKKKRRNPSSPAQDEDNTASAEGETLAAEGGNVEGGGGEEEGDAYYAYAHGARSTARAAATAARRGGPGDGGGSSVLHLGSCHCGGLVFEVEAPEHLVAIEGPSKVRYPFITVPAECFRLTSDDSNGSLYLLKCRPAAGTDSTPKVSAHFFCRRCGVHVVHAPDFPHAAVADVNVHCICPSTIKSLAVAFLRGGGVELPGMGDPVEGMYEVGRESWSDAMRERVSVALQQQFLGDSRATANTRALSPRRRSSSAASASTASMRADTLRRDLGHHGVRGRAREGGGGLGDGIGGSSRVDVGMRDPGVTTLRWNMEERERARPRSSTGGGEGRPIGNTWRDVLMHVASLPSSSSSSNSAAGSIHARKARSNTVSNAGRPRANGGDGWGPGTSELLLHAERDLQPAGFTGGGSGGRNERPMSGRAAGAAADGGVDGGAKEYRENGATSLRQRRSLSADSDPTTPHVAVSSPGAAGVAFKTDGQEASGGSRSSAGGGGGEKENNVRNGPHNSGVAGGGSLSSRAEGGEKGGVGFLWSPGEERDVFVRPPPSAKGVSGGFAAAQA